MTYLKRILFTAVLIPFLIACTTTIEPAAEGADQAPQSTITAAELEGTTWILADYGQANEAIAGVEVTAAFDNGNELHGMAGCNNYFILYEIEGFGLLTGELERTRFACPDEALRAQETTFLTALQTAESIGRQQDYLVITYPEGALRFMPEPLPPVTQLTGTMWQLEKIVPVAGDELTVNAWLPVTAAFADGNVGGTTSCNSYGVPYQINGQQFTVGDEFFRTEAECVDEAQQELETAFWDGLKTAETFSLTGDRLTIIYPDGELIFRAQYETESITPADENAIYAGLLRSFVDTTAIDHLVIQSETAFNAPEKSLDETLDFVANQMHDMLDETTTAAFRQQNTAVHSLDEIVDIPFPTIFITLEEVDRLFDGESDDWAQFQAQYPNTPGVITLSRIGFNDAGDQALVYLGLQTDWFTGGYYALFVKHNGVWTESRSFQIWES